MVTSQKYYKYLIFILCFLHVTCTPSTSLEEYEDYFLQCVDEHSNETEISYIDTSFGNPKRESQILRQDNYYTHSSYSPFPYKCLHIYKNMVQEYPNDKELHYSRYKINREIREDLTSFCSDRYSAIAVIIDDYIVFDYSYMGWVVPTEDQQQEFAQMLADMRSFRAHYVLPCGEDTAANLGFKPFYPSLREIKGDWYDRTDFLADLKQSTPRLKRLCAGWKRYFDRLKSHFPRHRGLALYDCYCIKGDTLLTQCQEDSLKMGNDADLWFETEYPMNN